MGLQHARQGASSAREAGAQPVVGAAAPPGDVVHSSP
jgi:hypothetical protein